MRPGIRIGILLCLSVILIAFLFAVLKPDSRIDLSERDYRIGQDVVPGWQRVCLFGQHEIPSAAERNYSDISCKLDFEIPSKTVVFSYYYESQKCEILKFKGYFLEKEGSETRCFTAGDANYLKIQYENEVITLELR